MANFDSNALRQLQRRLSEIETAIADTAPDLGRAIRADDHERANIAAAAHSLLRDEHSRLSREINAVST